MKDAKFFAARFRELGDCFTKANAMTRKGSVFENLALLRRAGLLFIDAVDCKHLRSLDGAHSMVCQLRLAEDRRERGDPGISFADCEQWGPQSPSLRAPCPENLFRDVAGDDRIVVRYENGVCKAVVDALPPKGLLPSTYPTLYPSTPYYLLRINSTNAEEAADFDRLIKAEVESRCALACRLLAEALDCEQPIEPDGPSGINQWRHNGRVTTGRR